MVDIVKILPCQCVKINSMLNTSNASHRAMYSEWRELVWYAHTQCLHFSPAIICEDGSGWNNLGRAT